MRPSLILMLGLVLWPSTPNAENLTFRSAADWQAWTLPAGALVIEDGLLRPVFNRRSISATAQGTIRAAGTNPAAAAALIDGDRRTGWAPDPAAPLEDWWVEIDLGQVLPAQQLRLYFDPSVAPFEFFKVSTSNGERFINSANVIVEGTLLFSRSERFSFNKDHILTIDLHDEPVRAVRIEVSRQPAGPAAPVLTEVELDAFGDNIAFDLLAKGGSVDVQAEIVAVAGTANVMFDGDLVSAWRALRMSLWPAG